MSTLKGLSMGLGLAFLAVAAFMAIAIITGQLVREINKDRTNVNYESQMSLPKDPLKQEPARLARS